MKRFYRRRSRAFRQAAKHPRFDEAHHDTLSASRRAWLEDRTMAEIAAGEALGLQAMNSLPHSRAQLDFLRDLVGAMGAPEKCRNEACRTRGVCSDPKVECYWRNREYVRAAFPQIDDTLMRMALTGRG